MILGNFDRPFVWGVIERLEGVEGGEMRVAGDNVEVNNRGGGEEAVKEKAGEPSVFQRLPSLHFFL